MRNILLIDNKGSKDLLKSETCIFKDKDYTGVYIYRE